MIPVPGFRGAAFTSAADGNAKSAGDRTAISQVLGVSPNWAMVDQVHGTTVVEASAPGWLGQADALFTDRRNLPIAVFAADCVPVVMEGPRFVGAAHAGWRGLASGVIEVVVAAMAAAGSEPVRAAVGPAIGPCCYEVGPEVIAQFPEESRSTTTWGTPSVDLVAEVRRRVPHLEVWSLDSCTRCGDEMHSFRRDGTAERMAGVGWIP
ncbi:MAG: polyphenol oxidase family protein [Acidimicrobiia bacterium]|nr:polyphenol oxidase family protein [Acidimicrobiia bacterium]